MAAKPKDDLPAKPATPELKTYKVISNLEHDGKLYQVGDEIELEEQLALPLLGEVLAK